LDRPQHTKESTDDRFGFSVAVTTYGGGEAIAVVGAPYEKHNANGTDSLNAAGAVSVLKIQGRMKYLVNLQTTSHSSVRNMVLMK